MSKLNTKAVMDLFEEIFRAFAQSVRYGIRLVGRMSPPALLGAALLLAFIFSILPLALVLLVVFMLIKLSVAACVIGKRRQRLHREPGQ
jgi:hypothetical protein